eukprot:tig00021318_g20137.t1
MESYKKIEAEFLERPVEGGKALEAKSEAFIGTQPTVVIARELVPEQQEGNFEPAPPQHRRWSRTQEEEPEAERLPAPYGDATLNEKEKMHEFPEMHARILAEELEAKARLAKEATTPTEGGPMADPQFPLRPHPHSVTWVKEERKAAAPEIDAQRPLNKQEYHHEGNRSKLVHSAEYAPLPEACNEAVRRLEQREEAAQKGSHAFNPTSEERAGGRHAKTSAHKAEDLRNFVEQECKPLGLAPGGGGQGVAQAAEPAQAAPQEGPQQL